MTYKLLVLTAGIVMSAGIVLASDITAQGLMDDMKSHLDLGFKQQDKVKPLVNKYIELLGNLRAQHDGKSAKVLAVQIMMLNQQFEEQLQAVLTPEQMSAFKSVKRSILASSSF